MKYLSDYITTLLAEGKHFFTKQEATYLLKISDTQFRFQAYRLSQKKVVKRLVGDFFMIIPPEYYHLGSLPPTLIINSLMEYLGRDYYVGLLSAAALYGATEQQPMTFQVITNKATKKIDLERGSIEFHVFSDCPSSSKTVMNVATGHVKVSTREQTIVDLVRFYTVSGYMSNVALVIKSLTEEVNLLRFHHVVSKERYTSVLQRLGYIFEFLGLVRLAEIIDHALKNRKMQYILFRSDYYKKTGPKNSRWKLIINDTLELS